MPASAEVIAHSPPGSCSARKCFRAVWSTPSLRWSRKQRLLLEAGEEALGALGVDVRDPRHRFGQIRLVGLLHVADDPAVIAAGAGIAEELDALAGRHASDEALALDVSDERRA